MLTPENEVFSSKRVHYIFILFFFFFFLYVKNYFTVETSVFVEKNLYKFRFLFGGKDRFLIKNTSVNTENEVFSSKRVHYIFILFFFFFLYVKNYFTVETSVFVEKNLYKFRFLFGGKDRFVIKNTSVNTENEVLSSKRVLYI